MSERKFPFSVSDREKIGNCLCMKCEHLTCLKLDGKICNLLISISKNTSESDITLMPHVTSKNE
ncbi:MAG: hypothetical protein PHO37_16365 [Kiritimatiellae bacterium]|nr:hypothetical protein [Kiritimatiellia bacterium]